MSGFSNAVVGGMSKLVRAAIQSPNYLAGALGWTINKDGSAEFNNLTVRGVVALTPTAFGGTGNLYWSDDAPNHAQIYEDTSFESLILNGQHANGVDYTQIMIWPDDFRAGSIALTAWRGAAQKFTDTIIDGGNVSVAPTSLASNSPEGLIQIGATGNAVNPGGSNKPLILFGVNAFKGKYYFEESLPTGQAIPNGGAPTVLTGLLGNLRTNSDYGSEFAANQWTCPVSGPYKINFVGNIGAASAGRFALVIYDVTTASVLAQLDQPSSGSGNGQVSFYGYIPLGDVIQFQMLQTSGAGQNIQANTKISVGRDL